MKVMEESKELAEKAKEMESRLNNRITAFVEGKEEIDVLKEDMHETLYELELMKDRLRSNFFAVLGLPEEEYDGEAREKVKIIGHYREEVEEIFNKLKNDSYLLSGYYYARK